MIVVAMGCTFRYHRHMAKRQDSSGGDAEWAAFCAELRRELLQVCPKRQGTPKMGRPGQTPGTTLRSQVATEAGVNLYVLRRFLDDNLPITGPTAAALAEWLGLAIRLERFRSVPTASGVVPEKPRRASKKGERFNG